MEIEDRQPQERVDSTEELVMIIEANGHIVRINQAWIDFNEKNGFSEKDEDLGSNYFEKLQKLGKYKELEGLKKAIKKGVKEYTDMLPIVLKNSTIQWFSVKVRSIKIPHRKSKGFFISLKPKSLHTLQPITAESVLESMTEGFALLDDHYKIHYLNEYGEKVLKCRRDLNIGMNWWELFPETIGSRFQKEFEAVLEHEMTVQFEEFSPSIDTWLSIKAYPLAGGGMALYFQDINDRKISEAKLKQYAYADFLTGLPNRRAISELANSLIHSKKRFTLFYINLDNLKFVNALHNYSSGDKVLVSVANKLKQLVDSECAVGRLDGDEFVVIRQPKEKEDLERFAERLKEVFTESFFLEDRKSVSITSSIGIACYPYDTKSLGEVLSFAETAMFEAKKTKGTSYKFFRKIMNVERERRVEIEKGLMGDLNNIGFYFTLQPQIDGETGDIIGVEILSRWKHPKLGELSPLEFIEVAEQSSTIGLLTHHLLTQVFAKIKEWESRFGWSLKIAVNMTSSLMANRAFFDDFFALIDQYEIPADLIEIELTEQAELTYSEYTLENLLLCKSKGISIAIDDFGTGFSMIAYLTQFPINKIKLDKSFIQKIGQDKKSEAVLTSLIHLANSIECELLAEGVERPEEVRFLKKHFCTVFQGYYFDKPMKADDFEEKYLRKRYQFSME